MKSRIKNSFKFELVVLILVAILMRGIPSTVSADLSSLTIDSGNHPGAEIPNDPSRIGVEPGEQVFSGVSELDSGLSFTVKVPSEQMTIDSVSVDGKNYLRPTLPGWSQGLTPGMPALPLYIGQIGVPFGANIELSVIPGKAHVHNLSAPVLPAPTQKVDWAADLELHENALNAEPIISHIENPAIYDSGRTYPGNLVEVTGDGVLRQQRVVAITAYPAQYDPSTRQLIVYESLQITVKFEGSYVQTQGLVGSDSPAFENLLAGELLNYDSAKKFRSSGYTTSMQVEIDVLSQNLEGAPIPWVPPEPGYRIRVREEGFYKISYADLAEPSLGIPVSSLDPRTFQMFNLGNEIAIEVVGEGDGSFDAGDYLLFYGEGIESKYTSDNIYWLSYDPEGIVQGKRIPTRDGTPGTAAEPIYYSANLHQEEDNYYYPWIPFPDDTERWWWGAVQNTTSWNHSFTLVDPYTGALAPGDDPAQVTVSVVGYSSYTSITPDHHAGIFINGFAVGDMTFDGREWKVSSFQFDQGILKSGSNTIELRWINDTGAASDIFMIDYIQLDYPNRFHAESDALGFVFETPGTWKYFVEGFSSNQIRLYDISDPTSLVAIENFTISPFDGGFAAEFEEPISGPTRYWAMAEAAYLSVLGIEADNPSNLRSAGNAADHIVITHETFWSQALTLSDHRSAEMRAVTVDVQDIFDEFNYGIAGAVPVRDFLAYVYHNWQAPAPSYVVLMGDGHYDPKQNYYTEKTNYIMPYLLPVDPWMGETASDNRYVTIVGEDTLPDMMIGRLAVNNTTEANTFVSKIINYEAAPEAGDWQEQILAVADNADVAGNFPAISDYLVSTYIAPPYSAEKVHYLVAPYSNIALANTAIVNGINAGKLIVNYVGHAGYTSWGDGFFKAANIVNLTNGARLPVMLEFTCYSGSFHLPGSGADYDALAEVATRTAGKGTVANWAATGEGVSSGHIYLNSGFFEAFFHDDIVTLGDATIRGKFNLWSTGSALDLLDTYTLFGDPALVIVRPETSNHPPAITEGSSVSVSMSENGSPVGFSLTLHATDADGDPLTWTVAGEAVHGTATASGTGTSIGVGYTPDNNYSGTDAFIVQVSDGSLADQIVVNVIIGSVNDPPVAVNDTVSTSQNTQITLSTSDLMANDTDPDTPHAELSIIGVSNPINGTVTLQDETITFTPNTDFSGTAGFDYTLSDGELTDIGHVTVNVNFVNTPPVAADDAYITLKNQALTISVPGVLGNDIDPEGFPVTAELVSPPSSRGSVELSADGSFIYTPKNNFTGSETFTYVAYDGVYYSNVATVTITVQTTMPQVSIPLTAGWNLVSFNLQPLNTAVEDVLGSITGNFSLVHAWDALGEAWLLYDPAAPYGNDLQNLDHTMGFWIYMTTADDLVITGMPPSPTNISLKAGWNLVGYPSADPFTLPEALTNHGVTEYSAVWAYVANDAYPWKLFDPAAPLYNNNLVEMTPGFGYWINVSVDSTWSVLYGQP